VKWTPAGRTYSGVPIQVCAATERTRGVPINDIAKQAPAGAVRSGTALLIGEVSVGDRLCLAPGWSFADLPGVHVRDKPVLRRPERSRYRGDVVAVGLVDHQSKLRRSPTRLAGAAQRSPHPDKGTTAGAHIPVIRLVGVRTRAPETAHPTSSPLTVVVEESRPSPARRSTVVDPSRRAQYAASRIRGRDRLVGLVGLVGPVGVQLALKHEDGRGGREGRLRRELRR
jgi:hypothetical protein